MQDLEAILRATSSPDNNVRSQAEKKLNEDYVFNKPDVLLTSLVKFINSSADPSFRSFCAIILRRLGLKEITGNIGGSPQTIVLWDEMPQDIKLTIQKELLNSLISERELSVRRKVCDTIAEIANTIISDDIENNRQVLSSWNDLLPVIMEQASCNDPILKETAYLIFAAVPEIFSYNNDGVLRMNAENLSGLNNLLATALQFPTSEVRLVAMKSVSSLLTSEILEDIQRLEIGSQLVPIMANILLEWYQSDTRDESNLTEGFTLMIEMAELYPKLFKQMLVSLVKFVAEITGDTNLEDNCRQTALELAVTLCEEAPGMCRKMEGSFSAILVPPILSMMTEIEDDPSWYEQNDDDLDMEENYIVGEQAMDRIARSLGGKNLLPPVFSQVPQYFGSENWTQRHAALMCISAIAEGCHKIMLPELGQVIDMVAPHVRDSHPRVKYGACHCLGQLATDFEPDLQEKFHEPVMSALILAMGFNGLPRVQTHAAAALVNFCEGSTSASVEPYLEVILQKLSALLQIPVIYLREQTVTTLATVAHAAGEKFKNYYDEIFPVLLNILASADGQELRLLRGKVIECSTLISMSVGKDQFLKHAKNLLDVMVSIQQTPMEDDDPQVGYLIEGWARVCKVLGQDFSPYLPIVMPPLLKSAGHKPDFAVIDAEEDHEGRGFSEEDGWEFVVIDDKRFCIKTTSLDEKCTALEMLSCYAKELGETFRPYAEQVIGVAVPLIKFYFHEGVRQASATLIPFLLRDLKPSQPSAEFNALWIGILSSIIEALEDETEFEVLSQLLIAFFESMEITSDISLADAVYSPLNNSLASQDKLHVFEAFIQVLCSQLNEVYNHARERENQKLDEDLYDPEMEEELEQAKLQEILILGELGRAVHIVFKTQAEAFFSFFQKGLLPYVKDMLLPQPDSVLVTQYKKWALCVVDDVIEFCGIAAVSEFRADFWNIMQQSIMDESPEIRQAAAYGIQLLAQKLHESRDNRLDIGFYESWETCLMESLNVLFSSINGQLSTIPEHQQANINVIKAIGNTIDFVVLPLHARGKLGDDQRNAIQVEWEKIKKQTA